MSNEWTIIKDSLSFIGAVIFSIPWFLDFIARVDLSRLKRVRTQVKAFETVVETDEAWLAAPKMRDLVLASIGLLMLCASFLIALCQSLKILPG